MSNTNNNMQTQTSSALHNAIMKAGGKDHPPMLAPDANATSVTPGNGGIDNDIYSTVDACPNAMRLWKAIKMLKQGKAIANSPPPNSDPELKVVADDDAPSKEKEIDKLIALISIQTGQYNYQRENSVVEARENVGTQVVQQTGIHCYNCEEFGHAAKECQKPKWTRDSAYHKEKMLMCKKEEVGIQLSAKQVDWRDDIDDEPEDQELEAHYIYIEKIQE
nr:hypothetical protein [Tanacetum cinerariifolium]